MKRIYILYCNTCKDKIVLTNELKECTCKQVMGFINSNNDPEIAGYNGALMSPDFDAILNLPDFNQSMIDADGIMRLNPLFEIRVDDNIIEVRPQEVNVAIVPPSQSTQL